jgi:hypothetical protein
LCRLALIVSAWNKSSRDNCLTLIEIECLLKVTFVIINQTVMGDDTGNEIEYIKTISLNLKLMATIRVHKQEEHRGTSGSDALDTYEDRISCDELDALQEGAEGKVKQVLPVMLGQKDDSNPAIRLITDNSLPSQSSGRTSHKVVQDFVIHNKAELHQGDAAFNKCALTELDGANNPIPPAQGDNQTDNLHVDC